MDREFFCAVGCRRTMDAGLLNVFITSLLFCRLPALHAPANAPLFMRAAIYVAITFVAGIAGMRFYWREPSRYAVPEQSGIREPKMREFDAITVMFLADPLHRLNAPKIAIEQYEIIPR